MLIFVFSSTQHRQIFLMLNTSKNVHFPLYSLDQKLMMRTEHRNRQPVGPFAPIYSVSRKSDLAPFPFCRYREVINLSVSMLVFINVKMRMYTYTSFGFTLGATFRAQPNFPPAKTRPVIMCVVRFGTPQPPWFRWSKRRMNYMCLCFWHNPESVLRLERERWVR